MLSQKVPKNMRSPFHIYYNDGETYLAEGEPILITFLSNKVLYAVNNSEK